MVNIPHDENMKKEADELFYSDSNLEALKESRKQIEEGKVVEKDLDELLAMED